ncbi:restriction endonuclease [Caproicibacter sp.]|uniref:restriction endonuclease n=1 Tax=Caproicibacter sp. TaxID=2814884 RepID=UPI0039899ACB
MEIYNFDELTQAPLLIDAIYKGGTAKNISAEPLHTLLPRTSNQGGFRITHRQDNMNLPAYVVIYTSLSELEWPDYLDAESGVFRYYGDNRHPGNDLHDTRKKGNALLRDVFSWLNNPDDINKIPPFLIFQKTGDGRDVKFLGLAALGNINIPPDRDLISFWRTMNDQRFQNYEAYFTILDLKQESICKDWLISLVYDYENNIKYAPMCWKSFISKGRNGIKPLKAPKIQNIPSKYEQLTSNENDNEIIQTISDFYKSNPQGFEKCASSIIQIMDPNFYEFNLTRPWRDGGRDALGKYRIGVRNNYLNVECALEAKCYSDNTSVGVKETSRLISRIKYRQFGILVTTSYVDSQARKEILEDGHPILLITAKNIASILRSNGIVSSTVQAWLKALE